MYCYRSPKGRTDGITKWLYDEPVFCLSVPFTIRLVLAIYQVAALFGQKSDNRGSYLLPPQSLLMDCDQLDNLMSTKQLRVS